VNHELKIKYFVMCNKFFSNLNKKSPSKQRHFNYFLLHTPILPDNKFVSCLIMRYHLYNAIACHFFVSTHSEFLVVTDGISR
jgi:3-hydroxy-3-methylglutaryl CoA synthase